MKTVEEILKKIGKNKIRGSESYYEALPEDESEIIRKYYADRIGLHIGGGLDKISNALDTVISNGYSRIVVGDYGAYLEFDKNQLQENNIEQRWPGKLKRKVKYIWMQTKDKEQTKVYWQQGTVDYADYKIGMYYMDILDAYM